MSYRYTQTDRKKNDTIHILEYAIQSGRYDADYIPVIESCITALRNAGAGDVDALINSPPIRTIVNNEFKSVVDYSALKTPNGITSVEKKSVTSSIENHTSKKTIECNKEEARTQAEETAKKERCVTVKKALRIVVIILGFAIFFIGILLLINSGGIAYNSFDRKQFVNGSSYEFVRDETAQGIQTAGKMCAFFGGATALLGLFKSKKDQ